MNRTSCKTHGMYDDRSDGCPVCRIEELEEQLSAAHTLIHQIEDEIKYTGSEIHVRKSINNYKAAIGEGET